MLLPNRRPNETISANTRFGKIHATISYHPETGLPCEFFFTGRGKTGQAVDEILYELGVGLSRALQGKDP